MSVENDRQERGEGAFEPFWSAFSCFDPASVVELISTADREIACAEARRLAWIATRHDQVLLQWESGTAVLSPQAEGRRFTDAMDQLVGEVGAAIGRGPSAARGAIELAVSLRDRLPQVFERLYDGSIGLMAARTVVRRCEAVTDRALLHRFDVIVSTALARRVRRTGVLTESDVKKLADGVLAKLDPDAVPTPAVARRRGVWFDARRDGLVELAGLLLFEDAALLERSIDRVAATVCRKDPRKTSERHADALVALVEGYESLGCQCESDRCDKRDRLPKHATVEHRSRADVTVVISEATLVGIDDDPVLIESQPVAAAVGRDLIARVDEARFEALGSVIEADEDASADAESRVDTDGQAATHEREPAEQSAACNGPSARARARSRSRRSRPRVAGRHRAGYRPSELQVRFLRIRYARCVFPGCSVPFAKCQLDHVTERNHSDPAAGGQTRVGNLVPLCGRHHRIKTEQDWLSDVLPGGEVEWHSPTGHVYRTALVLGDDLFDLDTLEWLEPVGPPGQPKVEGAPTVAQVRAAKRERRREHYRRERERLRRENPDDPRWNDSPPPY